MYEHSNEILVTQSDHKIETGTMQGALKEYANDALIYRTEDKLTTRITISILRVLTIFTFDVFSLVSNVIHSYSLLVSY